MKCSRKVMKTPVSSDNHCSESWSSARVLAEHVRHGGRLQYIKELISLMRRFTGKMDFYFLIYRYLKECLAVVRKGSAKSKMEKSETTPQIVAPPRKSTISLEASPLSKHSTTTKAKNSPVSILIPKHILHPKHIYQTYS
jgi:hypothetical protein